MGKPKILFIGIYAPTYHSGSMVLALKNIGYDVEVINWQQYRFQHGVDSLRNYVMATARGLLPDFIFMQIQNPNVFSTWNFQQLNDIAPVIHFTFDVRDDMSWYKEIAPLVALTCFASDRDVKDCKKAGIENVIRVHSSCDMDKYCHTEVKIDCPDIVFIGNDLTRSNMNFPQAQERKDMVAFMQKRFGSQFGVYGTGWDGSHEVNQQEEILLYSSCKIAITHNHFELDGYCSDRGWRAMSCGAFTINHFYYGIMDDLGWPMAWKGFDLLGILCDRALRDSYFRNYIAKLTTKEVRQRHTWTNRFEKIFKTLHYLG